MKIEFQKQFTGARTQGGDCGPTALIHLFHFATDNELSPTQTEIRAKGNIPDKEGFATDMDDLRGAYKAFRPLAKKLGYELEDFDTWTNVQWSAFVGHVQNGHGLILFIDHNVYRKESPKTCGDLNFDRNHAIFVSSEDVMLKGYLRVHDGLCDGRTRIVNGQPHKYPKGSRLVEIEALRKSAESYTSGPGVTFGGAKVAKRIVKEEPVDDVHAECKKDLTIAMARVVECTTKITALEKRNEQLTKNVLDLAAGRDATIENVGAANEALRNAKQSLDAVLEALK